jgi:hypothetical protein
LLQLLSAAAGLHDGLEASMTSTRQHDVDNRVELNEDFTVLLTTGLVPVGHSSSSRRSSRQQQQQPWT